MLKLFLSSHGHMASGLKTSVNILFGNADQLTVYDAYVDETSLNDALDHFYEGVSDEDQVIMLSDLYGGSVNNTMFTYLTKPNRFLVAGVNLALVIELLTHQSITKEELDEIVTNARSMMTQLVNDDTPVSSDDDFF